MEGIGDIADHQSRSEQLLDSVDSPAAVSTHGRGTAGGGGSNGNCGGAGGGGGSGRGTVVGGGGSSSSGSSGSRKTVYTAVLVLRRARNDGPDQSRESVISPLGNRFAKPDVKRTNGYSNNSIKNNNNNKNKNNNILRNAS